MDDSVPGQLSARLVPSTCGVFFIVPAFLSCLRCDQAEARDRARAMSVRTPAPVPPGATYPYGLPS